MTSQNYHLQLPPPYNSIILGGGKALTVKKPDLFVNNDEEHLQIPGIPSFYGKWPAKDVMDWSGNDPADFEVPVEEGGVWTGGAYLGLLLPPV